MSNLRRAAEKQIAGELDERARCLLAAARSLVKDPRHLAKAVLVYGSVPAAREQLQRWARELEELVETCEEFQKILKTPTIKEFIADSVVRKALGLNR